MSDAQVAVFVARDVGHTITADGAPTPTVVIDVAGHPEVADLARVHGADRTCPLTTGIFLRIVAEAAWEELQAGADPGAITPFWRVIAPDSSLARKLACGTDFIAGMRLYEQASHRAQAAAG